MAEWDLQDVENSFAALVDAALIGDPQRVTRNGKPAVVVLSASEYDRLCDSRPDAILTKDSPSTPASVPTFVEHLLNIPKGGGDFEFERWPMKPRSVDF